MQGKQKIFVYVWRGGNTTPRHTTKNPRGRREGPGREGVRQEGWGLKDRQPSCLKSLCSQAALLSSLVTLFSVCFSFSSSVPWDAHEGIRIESTKYPVYTSSTKLTQIYPRDTAPTRSAATPDPSKRKSRQSKTRQTNNKNTQKATRRHPEGTTVRLM